MSTTTPPHVLVVSGPCEECSILEDFRCDREGQRHTYNAQVECPGVTEACRMWFECRTCPPAHDLSVNALDELYDGADRHGQEHRLLDGLLMTPTQSCFVQFADNLSDAIDDLPPLAAGRHAVSYDIDESSVYLSLVAAA